jgi:D-glycerate 3-kinase
MNENLSAHQEQLPDPAILEAAWSAIGKRLHAGLTVAGICGSQASGKSTLSAALVRRAQAEGVAAGTLSLDDLYLTRAERAGLADQVHPLLRTRGVPGTHDIALGLETIAALERGEPAPLPRFDKGADDRAPQSAWDCAPEGTRLLILEGWCTGAAAQDAADLTEPVNDLERDEDTEGVWRCFANQALAGEYQALFARLDLLILLAAPGFETVFGWRRQQEQVLHARKAPQAMEDAAIARFIKHYERLTNHILDEMPGRADLVAWLAEDRSALRIEWN